MMPFYWLSYLLCSEQHIIYSLSSTYEYHHRIYSTPPPHSCPHSSQGLLRPIISISTLNKPPVPAPAALCFGFISLSPSTIREFVGGCSCSRYWWNSCIQFVCIESRYEELKCAHNRWVNITSSHRRFQYISGRDRSLVLVNPCICFVCMCLKRHLYVRSYEFML